MPTAALKPCQQSGCNALIKSGAYCAKHKKQSERKYNATRQDSRFYMGRDWQRVRREHIEAEPVCRSCKKAMATQVDHIIPRSKGGSDYDHANLQSLCHRCHSRKTINEQRKEGKL
jgi:5-methylcytosine-specific restriction enzyme A